ncbi:MAG: hypothetical protein QGG73_04225 [Candidatus Hydrogenedentes bacterium]|jgi:hypothetical protein|nr:hypothetical protein [Candidatus Hydrogenedentota bacterium]|tara:strand:- start:120 stop:245 length:126 start_codon:yes stop_codon:yes gene_type:complete
MIRVNFNLVGLFNLLTAFLEFLAILLELMGLRDEEEEHNGH